MKANVRQTGAAAIERLHNYTAGAALHLAAAVAGFILARAPVFGSCAPFGLALCAGVPTAFTLTAAVGALAGYFIPVTGSGAFRYIAAVFAIASIKWMLNGIMKIGKSPLFSAAVSAAAAAVTGAAAVMGESSPASVILTAAESLLAGGGAYFIHRSTHLKSKKVRGLTSQELSSAVIAVNILLIGLIPLQIGEISIGRILAALLVVAAGRYGRETSGAIAGVAAGFAVAFSGKEYLFAIGIFALGGLLAGLFSPMGRFASALAFVLSGGLITVLAGSTPEVLLCFLEVLIASVLFLVLPRKAGVVLADLFSPPAELPRLDGLRKSLVMRLEFASEALCDVSQTVEEVAARLSQINAPDFDEVLSRVENDACKGCTLRMHCWETVKAETLAAMVDMTKAIKQGEYSPETKAPEPFAGRCLRLPAVGRSLFTHFSDYASRQAAENRIAEVRSVVSDQFDGISNMLSDLAEEFQNAQQYDTETAARIVEALKEIGIITADCGCCLDKYGRMTAEIRIRETGATLNRASILREIQHVCEREFDPPSINRVGGELFITLSERAEYSAEIGVSQFSCGLARMCGDAYQYFNDGKGRFFMIVSDGMGTGGRAAVDGAMAAGLMTRLIRAGFGFDCSLRIVNSAMLFKSTDESLATVDVACMDLFTGQTELLKAGAAPTLVRRSGRTGKAECSSLPAGILREIGFDRATVSLRAGDVVLMLSDGAATDGVDWICAELEAWRDGTAQQLSDHIAAAARRRRNDGHEDDITVMAAVLQKAV